ncbi:hypothetical protein AYO21_11693 [Fonsecaea monophora]|uniref:Uncharacterized protein n=1 Tax=Fonsecaea monophora TaxID=254056 RepID=A0A177ERT3_9EURO|nr:hypothetical protein AYO21_11693 [Fonsecaea monophora]KAH0829677.1 putative oxidoreductase [Fonsecaea pedrosoi]OAG34161.1 hypothetical protein AYO21_11693 [Fonsecaea monophora]
MSHPPPERFLHGKVAIVTGAGSLGDGIGNGRAAALLLAQDGCSVVCVDLKQSLAQRTVEMIESVGHGAGISMAADVTKEEDCQKAVALAVEKYGRLDILVNNVGITGPKGTTTEVDMQAFYKAMEVNVGSMIMMAKYAIPAMKKNEGQCAGAIVNLASVAGLRGGHPAIFYPTSKGSVINLTRAMVINTFSSRVAVK